jgi:NAD/NADP transhydrogenase alpha subunit
LQLAAYQIIVFTDVVLKVRQPTTDEVGQFKEGGTLISFLYPGQNKDLVNQLLAKKLTAFGKLVNKLHRYFNTVNLSLS